MKKKLITIKILIFYFFFSLNYLYANIQNKIIADVENEIISSTNINTRESGNYVNEAFFDEMTFD